MLRLASSEAYGFRHTSKGGKCFDKWKAFTGSESVSNREIFLAQSSYLELNFAGNNNASGSMIDDKSKQWFGASVHSSGQDLSLIHI